MPSFDIAYSTRLPAVTQMPRANTNVDTGAGMIGQALSNLGGAINQIGTQYQEANNAISLSKTKRRYDEINAAAYNALDKVTTEEESQKVLSQYQADVAGLKSGNSWVDQRFDMHVDDTITGVTQQFADKVKKNNVRKLNDEFEIGYQGILETGNYAEAKELIDNLVSTGQMSEVAANAKKKQFFGDALLSQANRLIAKGDPDSMVTANNILNNIQKVKTAEGKVIEMTTPQLEQIRKLQKIAIDKNELVTEEAHKQLSDLMAGNNLTVAQVQARRNALSAEDYEQWTKIAISPIAKPGNTIAETALKSAAIDVWRGTISKKDFDAKVRASMADPNGINDKQYAAVMSDADKELKQTQAEDMRRYSKDAANVILGQYSGLMQFDAMGNLVGVNMASLSGDQTEDLKYRMHFHSLYEQGLRDYIAEHPDASGKDFYLFAREQKLRYWNTSFEQMKAIAKELPPVTPGTPLDADTAKLLLKQSNGNRQQAEQKAKDLGYTF